MKLYVIAILSVVAQSMAIGREISDQHSHYQGLLDYSDYKKLKSFFEINSKRNELWTQDYAKDTQKRDYLKVPIITPEHSNTQAKPEDQTQGEGEKEVPLEQKRKSDIGTYLSQGDFEQEHLTHSKSSFPVKDKAVEDLKEENVVVEMSNPGSMVEFEPDWTFKSLLPKTYFLHVTEKGERELEEFTGSLEARLQGLKSELEDCIGDGSLDIGLYAKTKLSILKAFNELQLSDIPDKLAEKVQGVLDDILRISEAMNKVAIWLCVNGEGSQDECMHFSFDEYVKEVRYLNGKAETILMDILFTTSFNETEKAEVQTQKARLDEVQKIDTLKWKNMTEYESLEKMKDDISLMLSNSEIVLNNRVHGPTLQGTGDSNTQIVDVGEPIYHDI